LLVRFAPLGLPWVVTKYGGSALWALLIYWLVSALLPTSRLTTGALVAAAIAAAVEFGKLLRAPNLDAFRHTIPGILLLGRVFSVTDLLVYGLAIVGGVVLDRRLRRRPSNTAS
jgi:hypothetical protein